MFPAPAGMNRRRRRGWRIGKSVPRARGDEPRAKGAGSTMLTGPQGVSQDALSLGKNTLLGG